jgi:hypothetical protein
MKNIPGDVQARMFSLSDDLDFLFEKETPDQALDSYRS